MTLKTRVLSLVLAGSMMLSVAPVSAFAQANDTGGGISLLTSAADAGTQDVSGPISISDKTYDVPLTVVADNVTLTNCTFNTGLMLIGNNIKLVNCKINDGRYQGKQVYATVIKLSDYVSVLNSQSSQTGQTFTTAMFPDVSDPDTTSVTIAGGTHASVIACYSGTLTIESGTFTGLVTNKSAVGGNNGIIKITGGLFAQKPEGYTEDCKVYKLDAPDAVFSGMASPVYVANETATPEVQMVYSGETSSRKLSTWRLEMSNDPTDAQYHKAGFADDAAYAAKLQAAGYDPKNPSTVTIKCIGSIQVNGHKIDAMHGDVRLDPVFTLTKDVFAFDEADTTAPVAFKTSVEAQNAVTDAKNPSASTATLPKLTLTYTNTKDSSKTFTAYPTSEGTYQVSVKVDSDAYLKDGDTYYKAKAGDEFTDESWQFTITAGINADGKPTVNETEDWTYNSEDDTLTVKANGTLDLNDTTLTTDVTNNGTIESGTFTGTVTGGTIKGGVFANAPAEAAISSKAAVTVTGGATVNGLENDGTDEDKSDTVTVVTGKEQTIKLAADIEGHELIGWKATEGNSTPTLTEGSKVTIASGDTTARTFTPVVQVIETDLDMLGVTASDKADAKYYLLDAEGKPTGEGFDVLPEDAGTYAKFVELTLPDTDEENSIALYAADVTLDRVLEKGGIGYYVPELLQVSDSVKVGSDDTSSSSKDDDISGAAIAVAAVAGTAAVGTIAYFAGTQAYLNKALPAGTAIPTNRQQLADLLWTAAGKPEPAGTQLFTDISAEAVDSQKAALWCTEQGLMQAEGSTFKPAKHTFRPQVIKAWKQLQANQKAE